MPNEVRVLVDSHTDFTLFVTNLALIRVLRRILMKFPTLNIQTRYSGGHLKSRLSLLRTDANTLLMVGPLC